MLAKSNRKPKIAIVSGTGLSSICDRVKDCIITPFKDIKNFPQTTVVGHNGNLIFGTLNNVSVVCMQGIK